MQLSTIRRLNARPALRSAAVGLAAFALLTGVAGAADDNGLIDDYSYESPNYGYEVEWDDPWEADPSQTASEPRADDLTLVNEDDAQIWVTSMPTVGGPEEVVDAYLDAFAQLMSDDEVVEVGEADGVAYALMTGNDGEADTTMYVEVQEIEDGVVLITTLIAEDESFDYSLTSAGAEVEIDGEPTFQALDAAEDEADEDEEEDRADEDDDRDEDRRDDEDDDRDEDNDEDSDNDRDNDDEDEEDEESDRLV
jgi:hypothetical protein